MTKFVVITYYGHEPCDVYGVFDTYDAAVAWAMAEAQGEAWEVKEIRDVKETP